MLSSKYHAIDSQSLITIAQRVIWGKYGQEAQVTLRKTGKAQEMISLTLPVGDTLEYKPRLVLINSYDGSKAFHIHIGIFRMICSNGLIAGDDFYHDRIVHIEGPKVRKFEEEYPLRIAAALDQVDRLAGYLAHLQTQALTPDLMVTIIGKLCTDGYLPKQVATTVQRMIQFPVYRRPEDRPDTVYSLWNLINEVDRRFSKRGSTAYELRNQSLLNNIQDALAMPAAA